MTMIRVLRPSMPTADELLPFLREIDAARTYSNGGPLLRRLEGMLGELVGNPCTAVANGTAALELALRALNLPPGSSVLVPALTFVATGRAIVNAGLRPLLCDVDPETWQLDVQMALAVSPATISAVLPVAAFGAPVEIEPWEYFTYETGLPVLIDAAGAIYGQKASPIPEIVITYSLHATKALGAGEGGLVATGDRLLLERIERLASFGAGGTNAKLSEYHAAVALASIECNRKPCWRAQLSEWYEANLPEGLEQQRLPQTARTLFPVLLPEGEDATLIAAELHAEGVETRAWYRPFLSERPEFAHRFGPLPVTDSIQRRLLGLPWHAELTEEDVEDVCDVLADALDPVAATVTTA